MERSLTIDGTKISDQSDCYIIAEIGHNHQGDLEKAKQLICAAKDSGANAVKLQKRHNKTLYTQEMYNQVYDNPNSFGLTYGAHREFLEFEKDQYLELQKYSRSLGITFFSTAFDFRSADFLEDLNMPAYKMASGDLKNIPLLKHVAKFGKPMVISTGGGTMEDAVRAYEAILPLNKQLAILQCTAGYPCEFEELNLNVIQTFRNRFPECVIGFSGHDNGIAMALVSFVIGGRIVEKHFTLNRAMKGTDHAFSLEPAGMKKMVRDLKRARVAFGDGIKKPFASEVKPLIKMGKKIVVTRELAEGHVLTADDVALKSPGNGIQPYELEKVISRRLRKSVVADEGLSWDMLGEV